MGEDDLKKFMPAVLYKEIKSQLLKVSKQQDVGNCVVCLCDFEDDENIRSTYCKHVFHSECLTDWMKKNESCPYCRTPLNKDKIAEIFEQYKYNSLVWLQQEYDDEIKENSKMIGLDQSKELAKSDAKSPNHINIQKKSSKDVDSALGPIDQEININADNIQNQRQSSDGIQDNNANKQSSQANSQRTQTIQINSQKNQNIFQANIALENNKSPRKEDHDIVIEYQSQQQQQQQLQQQDSKRSQDDLNFQSSENVQTLNKLNFESNETQQGQQVSLYNTPGRENSIAQLQKSSFIRQSDSFSSERKSSTHKIFQRKSVKNSNFKNQTTVKSLLDNTQTNADSSFNNDIKSFGLMNQVVSIDQDSIYDEQVEKINSDFIKQNQFKSFVHERQSEDIFDANSIIKKERGSNLQVLYSEQSTPQKSRIPTFSYREPQTTASKRKSNSRKNTQNLFKNTPIQQLQKIEENKELRQSLKDLDVSNKNK